MNAPGVAARAHTRPHLLAAIALALLLLAGCGGTSTKSTKTTTSTSTATAPQGRTTSSSTTPAPSSSAQGSASSPEGGPATVTASAGGVSATMHAATHHPKVNRSWPIRFSVTRGGRPVHASVEYEYLFAGQVVAHRSHYTFTGHFSDVFNWPASAVGYPLTFRAVIVAGTVTLNLDYAVQVST